jgi:hypothetical protein
VLVDHPLEWLKLLAACRPSLDEAVAGECLVGDRELPASAAQAAKSSAQSSAHLSGLEPI